MQNGTAATVHLVECVSAASGTKSCSDPATATATPYGPIQSVAIQITGNPPGLVSFNVAVDPNGKPATVHVVSGATNVQFTTGTGAGTWSYTDNVGYSVNDTITVTVSDPGRTTVTKSLSQVSGAKPPSVTVVKGAHCGPGTGLNCQSPEVCNNSDCYRITVITADFTSNVTCTLDSSIGAGGINTPFTMGGTATKATTYWFGAPGGWVSATCNGVRGQSAPW
jgi:hypothetical protein